MDGKALAMMMKSDRKHLMNVVNQFKPEHGGYAPTADMYTVAEQIRHIALTIDWFREGAWGAGFDMDFEGHVAEVKKPGTLEESKALLAAAYDRLITLLEGMSAAEAHAPIAENMIMGSGPRSMVLGGITDHTAHHRGALTVYLRLLGIVPKMVYLD